MKKIFEDKISASVYYLDNDHVYVHVKFIGIVDYRRYCFIFKDKKEWRLKFENFYNSNELFKNNCYIMHLTRKGNQTPTYKVLYNTTLKEVVYY